MVMGTKDRSPRLLSSPGPVHLRLPTREFFRLIFFFANMMRHVAGYSRIEAKIPGQALGQIRIDYRTIENCLKMASCSTAIPGIEYIHSYVDASYSEV